MHLFSRRHGRRLGTTAAALAAVAALSLASCSSGATGGSGGTTGSTAASSITVFNGSTGTLTENFNPFSPTALQPTLGVIYQPLYYYNLAADVAPAPMLATAHSWNANGTKLTITTRQGVKWSDGQPLTASDVAYTFNLINKTPELNTAGLNATAKATNDHTVVLTFKQTAFTQESNVLGNTAIIPEHVWSKINNPVTTTNSKPVGTGPYTLKTFSAQSYVLAKNTNYWEPGKPSLDQVRYISLSNADAASAALSSGQVDWMSSFLPGLDQLVAGQKDLSYVNNPVNTSSIFTCSNADLGCKGPQTDPAVRQAMNVGIDRAQLNQLAGGGFAGVGSPTLLLPGRDDQWIADPANKTLTQSANIDKAKAILDAAGWVPGPDGIRVKDGKRLSMTIQTVSGYSDFISLNETMTQELKPAGIELKPTQLAYNEASNNEGQGTFQLALESFALGASSDPYFLYNRFLNSENTAKVGTNASGGNTARYTNATVDKALAAAATTKDQNVQKKAYGTLQQQIVKDVPYIPIYVNSTLTEFNTSRATGWPTKDNPYAFPASWKTWDNGVVLTTIKASGK